MYGYRQRIGLILPSTNTVMESELNRMLPEGVSLHTTRVKLSATTPEGLSAMSQNAERAVDELNSCLSDVIMYSCTSGSFLKGIEWENNFRERLQQLSSAKVLTTSYACQLALEAFGKKNVSIATPYIDSLNDAANQYFTSLGYNIVSIKGLGIDVSTNIGKNPPHVNYRLGKEVVMKDTELLFLSCTGIRTMEIVEQLEQDLGIPVITSNGASLWAALRTHGLNDKLTNYGSLFHL